MDASEIMTGSPICISPETSIREALGKMIEFDVRHLPVLNADTLVGIVSDRDIRDFSLPANEQYYEPGDAHARLDERVSKIMTTSVFSVDEAADLSEVIDAMIQEKLSAIPVVRGTDGSLVGIVSYIDVLKAVRGNLE